MISEATYRRWMNKLKPYADELWDAYMAFEVAKYKVIDRMRNVFGFEGIHINIGVSGVKFFLQKGKKPGNLSLPPIFLPYDIRGGDDEQTENSE